MKRMQGRFRAAVLMGAAVSMLAFAAGARAQDHNDKDDHDQWSNDNSARSDNPWPYAATGRSPVLAVVGDISCEPNADFETGEKGHETCTTPNPPYTSTTSTPANPNATPPTPAIPAGPPYSLYQSEEATANQIEAMKPDAVALLGDLQYQVGTYTDFEKGFDLTYGAFKFLLRPSPGNHEFYDEHAETGVAGYGYFSYFNGFQLNPDGSIPMTTITDPCPSAPATTAAACSYSITNSAPTSQPVPRTNGQAGHFEPTGGLSSTIPAGGPVGVGDGWYSYNLGSWHLISLNIECSTQPGGCSTTGAWFASELEWLKKDLEENHSACTAAYWHQPTFSATDGITPEGTAAQAFWKLLWEHKADLVLNGHDHLYARYRPLDYLGNSDPKNGIREFIVGTGGETLDPVITTNTTAADPTGNPDFNALNLEKAAGDYWGVMALTLDEHGYKWDFKSAMEGPVANGLNNGQFPPVATPAASYSDSGFGFCHGSDSR